LGCNPHFNEAVQGVVIGDNNDVTLIFQNGDRWTIPFLAPPQPVHKLLGRDDLLNDLKGRLVAGGTVALIGWPGAGKTALLLALAYDREVLAHFCDGILWASLGREAEETEVIARLGEWGRALGISATDASQLTDVPSWARAVHGAIGTRRMLLIVDDAWHPEAALAFRLGGPNCAHLLTTRLPPVASEFARAGVLTVPELGEEDAMALLSHLAPQVVESEPEDARALVRAVDRLPLALTIVGNYLQRESHGGQPRRIRSALGRLQQSEVRLRLEQAQSPLERHPSLPSDTRMSLWAAIDVSFQALDEETRKAFRRLGLFRAKPNTFSEEAAVEVSMSSVETLDLLSDYGLLESGGEGRYTLHETINDYLLLEPIEGEALFRKAKFYLVFLTDKQTAYNKIDTERDNILEAMTAAGLIEWHEGFIIGANDFFPYLNAKGQFHLAYRFLGRAVELAEQIDLEQSGLRHQLARALRNLGILADLRRDYVEAEHLHLAALTVAREANADHDACVVLINLGVLEVGRQNYSQGEMHLAEALKIARTKSFDGLIPGILVNLSSALHAQGKNTLAKEHLLECLPIARQSSGREYLSSTLVNLGNVEYELGETARAEAYYEEALLIVREVGHTRNLTDTLRIVADWRWQSGSVSLAKPLYEEALTFAQIIRDPFEVCSLCFKLGVICFAEQDYRQAHRYLVQALHLKREFVGEVDKENSLRSILMYLGRSLYYSGEEEGASAKPFLEEALNLARNEGNEALVAELLTDLAGIALTQGKFSRAYDILREAMTLSQNLDTMPRISSILDGLGHRAKAREEYKLAKQYFGEALAVSREVGDIDHTVHILIELAWVSINLEDYRAATRFLRDGLRLINSVEHLQLLREARLCQSYLYLAQGYIEKTLLTASDILRLTRAHDNHPTAGEAIYRLAQMAQSCDELDLGRRLGQKALDYLQSLETDQMQSLTDQIEEIRLWLASLPTDKHS
jgi:tetratricopeptide (TPR) repeat protein